MFKIAIPLVLSGLVSQVVSVQLWASPGLIPTTVPAACRAALSTDVSCVSFVDPSFTGPYVFSTDDELKQVCTATCTKSLTAFQSSVKKSCADKTIQFSASFSANPNTIVQNLVWAYNTTCIKSGVNFCTPQVVNGTAGLCSDCLLKYEASLLGNENGVYQISPQYFASQVSSCGFPASKYPFTTPKATSTTSQSTPAAATPTCTGTSYTVKSGDTCSSIATANSIATDRFISDSYLDYNCTTLPVGKTVCLGARCKLLKITAATTCDSIINTQDFYLTQFLSWNPTVHSNCDNLGSMVGRSVCISPPGTTTWSVSTTKSTTSSISFVVPSSGFTPVTTTTDTLSYTTTWIIPTTTLDVSTETVTSANATAQKAINDKSQRCPFDASWYDQGIFPGDMPGVCPDLLQPYCFPNANDPTPGPTSFPAACLPQNLSKTGLSIPTKLATKSSSSSTTQKTTTSGTTRKAAATGSAATPRPAAATETGSASKTTTGSKSSSSSSKSTSRSSSNKSTSTGTA